LKQNKLVDKLQNINSLRAELAHILPPPVFPEPKHSTDGPSVEQVYRRGHALGIKAIVSLANGLKNHNNVDAFLIALAWVKKQKDEIIRETIDGSDPEVLDLIKGFERGIESGLNETLDAVREGYEYQKIDDVNNRIAHTRAQGEYS
jgi:hypothetical protein